ncbi:hypothetical protein IDM48_11530 (plasmid) [Rothia amarae]|uniref:FtsK domain-containing protein n=1 Tax=Rothia amarae TaxID=169480 RepID=A0A7S6WWP5_9MICC|nr:FtsK/SpoIIIE domain-containing protein [Rothia amarae]QOW64952.1 hypothetical protein IDM48_11530 [Rothia amarae]
MASTYLLTDLPKIKEFWESVGSDSTSKKPEITPGIAPHDALYYDRLKEVWADFCDTIGVNKSSTEERLSKSALILRREMVKKKYEVQDRSQVIETSSVNRGLQWLFTIPLGSQLSTYEKHLDYLSAALGGVDIEIESAGVGLGRMLARTVDPLEGSRDVAIYHSLTSETAVRMGRREDGQDLYIDMADAGHTIIQGQTRSGKSVFLYGLLSQLAYVDCVKIWGIDPNHVLLGPFRGLTPQIVLGTDPLAHLELLEEFVARMDSRIASLVTEGIEKISDFTPESPVEVLVLEEYASIIRGAEIYDCTQKPADRVGNKIKALVARIFAEGAKAGMRVILVIQRADASLVDGSTRANAVNRLTMGVDNGDAVRMLHPGASPELIEAITHFKNGRLFASIQREDTIAQADYIDYQDYRRAVQLSETAPAPIDYP